MKNGFKILYEKQTRIPFLGFHGRWPKATGVAVSALRPNESFHVGHALGSARYLPRGNPKARTVTEMAVKLDAQADQFDPRGSPLEVHAPDRGQCGTRETLK